MHYEWIMYLCIVAGVLIGLVGIYGYFTWDEYAYEVTETEEIDIWNLIIGKLKKSPKEVIEENLKELENKKAS